MRTYVFKVSLKRGLLENFKGVHRTIEIGENDTLDHFHFAIQDAMGWGADHLYSFFMSGDAWDEESEYNLPDSNGEQGGRDATKTKIKSLKLKPGQKFLYLFDYGDNWEFDVKLLSINEDAPRDNYPKLVESEGRAPEQYPSYED